MEALFVACDGSDDRERLYVAERLREEDIDVDVAHPSGEGGRTDTEPADAVGYDLVHVTGGDRDAEERSEAAEAVRRNAEEDALVTAAGALSAGDVMALALPGDAVIALAAARHATRQ